MNKKLFVYLGIFLTTSVFNVINAVDFNLPNDSAVQSDYSVSSDMNTDFQNPNVNFQNPNLTQNQAAFERLQGVLGEGKIREALRNDPSLAAFADKIGVINCGNRTILFGAVDTEKIHNDIVAKIRALGGLNAIQDKILVSNTENTAATLK